LYPLLIDELAKSFTPQPEFCNQYKQCSELFNGYGITFPGCKADPSPPAIVKVKRHAATPTFPYMPLWHA